MRTLEGYFEHTSGVRKLEHPACSSLYWTHNGGRLFVRSICVKHLFSGVVEIYEIESPVKVITFTLSEGNIL